MFLSQYLLTEQNPKLMEIKTCPTCKVEKNIENYTKNKTRKDGLQRECRECNHFHHSKHYHTKKSSRLSENLKEGHKVCTTCNQEFPFNQFNYSSLGRFNLNSTCKSCVSINFRTWKDNGGKEWENEYNKHRKSTDPQFKLKSLLRGRLLDALKRHTKGGKVNKSHSALTLLGCSIDEYKLFLENKFTEDMTWENHGKVWEIDHILPCDSFDLTNEEEQYKCFNYNNTQPLDKSLNRSKGNKII